MLHEGFGFFEGVPAVDEDFEVAGPPVADGPDVAGEAGFKGVVVGGGVYLSDSFGAEFVSDDGR